MLDRRLRLIRILAFILMIGLAIFSPLLVVSSDNAVKVDMNVPPQVARVAEVARPQPEVRIERVLKLEEFKGFDPDLASLFGKRREWQSFDDAQAFEQVASLSAEQGRVGTP